MGLAVIQGGAGAQGLARSSERLTALAADHPRDQTISFNQAWIALYQGDGDAARAALKRTMALTPGTRLGRTAAGLLAALDPAAEAMLREDQRVLWRAVSSLSERCQALLRIIAFIDRPDYGAVSEALGMPVGSIGPTRGRCLAKLRGQLAADPTWGTP